MTRFTTIPKAPPVLPGMKRGDVVQVDGGNGHDEGIVHLAGHDLRYSVRIVTGENGPQVAELHIIGADDRPITTDDLRAIPLRRIAAAVAQSVTAIDSDQWQRPEGKARHGLTPITDEQLREIAVTARAAFQAGRKVRETLAEQFGVSKFTVDKWLAKARDAGYLQPGELQRKHK